MKQFLPLSVARLTEKNNRFDSRMKYRNDPKFSDRQVYANSADPDQTAPRGAV